MVIILCLYVVALWLVFSKFKLVRWGWLSGTVSLLVGAFILATFLALFNYLTPSGRVTVTGRVVEVTPNVTGQIVAIPVKPNVPVKMQRRAVSDRSGTVSVQGHAVAGFARGGEATGRNPEIELRTGNGECRRAGRAARVQRQTQLRTFRSSPRKAPTRHSRRRTAKIQYETVLAQLNVAKAAQQSAKLALDSEIGGVNTTVAQIQAQLDNADWELSQTTIRAPADGYVTVVALSVGDRALQARSAMSFIVENEITLVGIFSQNGFQTIKEGDGRRYRFRQRSRAHLSRENHGIPRVLARADRGIRTLARTNAIGGATAFPAEISIPDEMSRDSLRLGMSGTATAFSENAGVIGLLASILVWISSYTAYL